MSGETFGFLAGVAFVAVGLGIAATRVYDCGFDAGHAKGKAEGRIEGVRIGGKVARRDAALVPTADGGFRAKGERPAE